MVRRSRTCLKQLPRDGAPNRRMQMGSQPALRLHHREVLHLEAGRPAEVLPDPVDELREVQARRGPRGDSRRSRGRPGSRPDATRPYDGSVKVTNIDGR